MILIDTQKEEFSKLKEIRIFGKIENENRFNGDLLVIGLGGVGSRVVTNLKGMLMNDIKHEDNINFLAIDSSIPEMQQTIEDSKDGIGLNALEVLSIYRPNLSDLLKNGIQNNPVHPNLAKWMRPDFPDIQIDTDGAKGNRQIGRLMFSNAYEDLRVLLFEKLDEIYKKSSGKLDVIIVSSVCGGTGSGILADLTYNVKAYGRSKKWKNYRVGGCLLMPDTLFGIKKIRDDEELTNRLLANGYATLKEINSYMHISETQEPFMFESTTHRLTMKENIFDACMLVSGKQDDQGYIPEGVVFSDAAYYLFKLAKNKYIGETGEDAERKLFRDSFFDKEGIAGFKVVNASDYKVPIREIENLCEDAIFEQAFTKLFDTTAHEAQIKNDIANSFAELRAFLEGKPGEEINLPLNGLIKPGQFQKPVYKMIKKGQDELRTAIPRQLNSLERDIPIIVKELKQKLFASLDDRINKYMRDYGPFIAIKMIGASGVYDIEHDCGMIAEVRALEALQKEYHPSGEFTRIKESILDIVAKRFFTFPSAKRETENGYLDACVKEALEKERTLIIDGLDGQDVFGDAIRLLRQKAEHLDDVFSPFRDDLQHSIEDLALGGKRVIGYLLKDSKRQEFLPSDYITAERIESMRRGIIDLMVNHEADIDNGRPVPIKQEMEKTYKNILIGLGAYAPEKLIVTAFANDKPTLSEANMMFVSPDNDTRKDIMKRAANAFLKGAVEKTEKKKLCVLNDGYKTASKKSKTFISLPEAMPYFSEGVKELFMSEPYNIGEESITLNTGEIEISVDDIFLGVPLTYLACAEDMRKAYEGVDPELYYGLHSDEVTKDMRALVFE